MHITCMGPSQIILSLLANSFRATAVEIQYYFSEITVRERHEFEDDGVTVILQWDEVGPLYSVNILGIPETQVNISNSTATLMVSYNVMYNVSVEISHLCDQSSITNFSNLYYYPRTSARELGCCSILLNLSKCNFILAIQICGNPENLIDNSVSILGYTEPAVEGTIVTFQCPPGLVLDGANSSTCTENGEWEPLPREFIVSVCQKLTVIFI